MDATSTPITLTEGTEGVTLVNVFIVDPARQTELLDALDDATRAIFTGAPGFISANLHISLDGKRVVNYAQWASKEHFVAALERPEVRQHIAAAAAIADSYDPILAQVHTIHHPDQLANAASAV
jgi:quinol monooxygenase YgiN